MLTSVLTTIKQTKKVKHELLKKMQTNIRVHFVNKCVESRGKFEH